MQTQDDFRRRSFHHFRRKNSGNPEGKKTFHNELHNMVFNRNTARSEDGHWLRCERR